MTLQEFSPIFGLLSVQLRFTDADEATIRGYHKALADLEPEFVALAATRMAQQGGSAFGDNPHWFPKTSEWRALAATVERERTEELRARLRKLPAPLCEACDDTGWDRTGDVAKKCACRKLRRLEVLGRRPMPELSEGA